MSTDKLAISGEVLPGLFASGLEYLVDTGQRSVLFLDVMRERGINTTNTSLKWRLMSSTMKSELILDGRTLQRPVNYAAGAGCPAKWRRD